MANNLQLPLSDLGQAKTDYNTKLRQLILNGPFVLWFVPSAMQSNMSMPQQANFIKILQFCLKFLGCMQVLLFTHLWAALQFLQWSLTGLKNAVWSLQTPKNQLWRLNQPRIFSKTICEIKLCEWNEIYSQARARVASLFQKVIYFYT